MTGETPSVNTPTRRDTILGIIFVNVATFSWATNISLGRYVRDEIGPFTLTAVRFAIAAGIFFVVLRNAPVEERRPGKDLLPLAVMALTGIVLFAPLLYFGLRYTTAVNGTLINGIGPLLTALFAAWFIREPYTRGQLVGALVAVLGVVFLITDGAPHTIISRGFNPGDLVVLVATAVWGLLSVASRRATRTRTPLSATALSMYMGLPVLTIAAVIEQRTIPVEVSPQLVLVILWVGLVPAGLGYFLWNTGVKKLGAGGAMVFYNTLPLYGTVLGVVFLGESLGAAHIAGGALIIAGGLSASLVRVVRG